VNLRHTFRGLLMLAVTVTAAARAQEPRHAEWRLVEAAPETLEYRNGLRNNVFDDKSLDYLRNTVVPQLALPSNRGTIDRVRRRIRDVACDLSGEQRALDQAGQFVITSMNGLAADATADLVVRVNAMLLVGDVNAKGGLPAPAAVVPLTEALTDTRLPAAVRIAALAGLARHAEAGPLPPPTMTQLVKLVANPAVADPVAADWLVSRGLALLAGAGAAAPRDAVAAAAAILADSTRPLDVRVRAAAVVGAAARPEAGIDVPKALAAIREVAFASLTQEATRDESPDLSAGAGHDAADIRRPPPAAVEVTSESPPQTQACRRVAWHLDVMASALARADGTGGLVSVAGPDAAAVQGLASVLRDAAVQIDVNPDVISVREALQSLEAAGAQADPAAPPPGGRSPPAADPGDVPFNPFGR